MRGLLRGYLLKVLHLTWVCVMLCAGQEAAAASYNWVGGTSNDWNSASNWSPASVPSSGDNAFIGVISFTNQPVINSLPAAIENLTFGTIGPVTLIINTGYTLTVNQTITQLHNSSNGGSITNILGQISAGVLGGSITCANFIIGDNTAPPAPSALSAGLANVTNTTVVNLAIMNFSLSGNLTLNTTSASAVLSAINTANVNNPVLNLNNGNLYVFNTIQTTNSNYQNIAGFTASAVVFSDAANLSQLIVNPAGNTGGTTPALLLAGATALNLDPQGSFVDFNGNGGGISTVYYDGVAQTIYTDNTAGLDNSPQTYQNLLITGTGAATINGGVLQVGNDMLSAAPGLLFNTNNPVVTVNGSWTNSSNVTQGTGDITIAGAFTNNAGGTLNLSAANLYIGGAYTNNIGGIYTQGAGTTYFNGGGAQALVDNSTTGTVFNNVTFNGGGAANMFAGTNNVNFAVSASSTLTVNNNTVLTAGTTASGGPSYLTLNSAANSSATVTPLTGTAAIAGNVNVQRFVTGGSGYRGYRLLSSPVYGNTDGNGNNIYSLNYLQNSCYVTGTTGTGGGFDKAGNPTIYLYRENMAPINVSFTSGNFRGVNTLGIAPNFDYLIDEDAGTFNMPAGNGYLFFFRGDRNVDALGTETSATYIPTNTILTATGKLNQGQVTVHNWYTPSSANLGYTIVGTGTGSSTNYAIRGFNFVGNPYASAIDWETYNTASATTGIYANHISQLIYELNPLTYNYDTYKVGGIYTNHGSNIIASGQGFFVVADAAGAELTFNESAKTTVQNAGLNLLMSTGKNIASLRADPRSHLRLQLAKDSINTDDIYIGFNSSASTQYAVNEDATYRAGTGLVNMASISSDNEPLAINILPLPAKSFTIPLQVNTKTDGLYKLNMTEFEAIPQIFDVWLMDAYKKDSLDMRHNKTYAFNLYHSDTASYGTKRFSLVIRQNAALGIHLLSFTAAKAPASVQLQWKTENEQNYTNFTVERSTDNGATFNILGGFASNAQGIYNYTDTSPAKTAVLYRIKIEDLNGAITYTQTITVIYNGSNNVAAVSNINIYPNPAVNTINVNVKQPGAGSLNFPVIAGTGNLPAIANAPAAYSIRIINSSGVVMQSITSAQPAWHNDISSLPPGTYVMQVLNNKDKSLIGRSAFVKM